MASAQRGLWIRIPDFLTLVLLAAVGIVLGGSQVSGQSVQGNLYDIETGGPVVNGNVALLDSMGAVVARTSTDENGNYTLRAPGPGVYSLLAVGMGYRSSPTGQFEVRENEVATVALSLYPQPIELDPLEVESRRQRAVARLRDHGFYERQQQGAGLFLNPEQLRQRPAITVGQVLQRVPFVQANWNISGSSITVTKMGRECRPAIYVDGNPITTAPENWVRPEDIIAVEVYRGTAQIPLQWASFQTCGVILIWTNLWKQ